MSEKIIGLKVNGLIGHGSFGYVFSCQNSEGLKIAWKRMLKVGKTVSRELELLEILKNCNYIVKLLFFFYSINYKNDLIQNFIFEYYPTNLEEILKLHQKNAIQISYSNIKKIIYQIMLGLTEMHKLGVCHRDLKPENILIKDNKLFIADLGSAKKLTSSNTPYVVSRYYRAPELILGIESYNLSIDLWSIAVIFFEFLFKKLPFRGKSEGQQLIEIYRNLGPPNLSEQEFLQSKIKTLNPEVDFVFRIEEEIDLWSEFNVLQIDKQERLMLCNWMRECWNYRFDFRPSVLEASQRVFWKDTWNDFDSFKLD